MTQMRAYRAHGVPSELGWMVKIQEPGISVCDWGRNLRQAKLAAEREMAKLKATRRHLCTWCRSGGR